MGAYNVVSRAAMAAGQPEDISSVLANLDAIAAVLNGGIDNSNLNAAAAIAFSKLAGYPADNTKFARGDGTWAAPSAGSLAYAELTPAGGELDVHAGTSVAPIDVVTAPAITVDGVTPILVEGFVPSTDMAAGQRIWLNLWEGANDLGRLGVASVSSTGAGLHQFSLGGKRRLTPTAGVHTYKLRAWALSNGVTAQLQGDTGGPGAYMPIFIRISLA